MAVYFFDSSTLVKRYAQETGTAWVQTLTAQHYVFLATVTEVEVIAAIERRKRIQTLTPADAAAATAEGLTVEDPEHALMVLLMTGAGTAGRSLIELQSRN